MKYLIIIFLYFWTLPILSDGKITFNCKVKDQIILEIDEGKPKRYSSYRDDLKNGDSHTFSIEWEKLALDESKKELFKTGYDEILAIDTRGEPISENFFITSRVMKHKKSKMISRLIRDDVLDNWFELVDNYDGKIYITNSHIELRRINFELSFKRYYKNDWDMFFSYGPHTLVSDCRDVKGNTSELIIDAEKILGLIDIGALGL